MKRETLDGIIVLFSYGLIMALCWYLGGWLELVFWGGGMA